MHIVDDFFEHGFLVVGERIGQAFAQTAGEHSRRGSALDGLGAPGAYAQGNTELKIEELLVGEHVVGARDLFP